MLISLPLMAVICSSGHHVRLRHLLAKEEETTLHSKSKLQLELTFGLEREVGTIVLGRKCQDYHRFTNNT